VRLTGAASESASSARDKVFARLPWDPVLRDCFCAISGPGLCVYVKARGGRRRSTVCQQHTYDGLLGVINVLTLARALEAQALCGLFASMLLGMSPPPDVWVYWAPPPKAFEQFRYLPLVATIETAFREHGNMSTVWTDASLQCGFNLTKQPDCHDVVRDLRRLGRRGKVGYLVVVGYWNRRVSYNTETIARCAAEPNVKLVLYQSEPLFGIGLAAAAEREREALSYQPDELWDYAQSNLLFLKKHGLYASLAHRFVPPSYCSSLDLGVSSATLGDAADRSIGFVGRRRPTEGWLMPSRAVFKLVQSWPAMKAFLQQCPVQAVFHRSLPVQTAGANSSHLLPFESFRGAVLAANKACIVAQLSHPADVAFWSPVVHFADTSRESRDKTSTNAFDAAWDSLQRCRERTYATFKRRYRAHAVLKAAGVFGAREINEDGGQR